MIGVILAGGSGTRFWPKSRELHPKQFLKIAGPRTMIQDTLERISPLVSIKKVFVITKEIHALETCKQLAEYGFNPENLLAEPEAKNTAPALGFAATALAADYSNEIMAVFPADHVVKDPSAFHKAIQTAETVAQKGHLVTLAVKPTRPETGYGYIKKGISLDSCSFKVQEFVEKPDLNKVQTFINDGRYFWNCGIFLWKISALLKEMENLMPALYENLTSIASYTETTTGKYGYRSLNAKGKKIYKSLQSISIDYGVLEKSKNVAVIPTKMSWTDVGSWSALEEIKSTDKNSNLLGEDVVAMDCSGSIIQGAGRLVVVVGARDLVIVDTPDALLVCDKKRSQDVKKVVEKLNSMGRPETKIHGKTSESWGSCMLLDKSETRVITKLEILPREKYNGDINFNKTWVIIEGEAKLIQGGEPINLKKNQSTLIVKGNKHQLINPGNVPLIILEIQIL